MGQRLIALAVADPALKIVAALEYAAHPKLGDDAGTLAGAGPIGVPLSAKLDVPCDVVVDFSLPKAVPGIVKACVERGVPLVVATTGLEPHEVDEVRAAAGKIALLWAPSMSMAVNLAMKLTDVAAKSLKDHPGGVDVEIIERHHRFKEDVAERHGPEVRRRSSPTRWARPASPRPRRPARQAAARRDRLPRRPHRRQPRRAHDHLRPARRNAGDHREGHQPRLLRPGALAAAKFLVGKPPELYGMNDVLGLA